MTKTTSGPMWMRFWFVLSFLWLGVCIYAASTIHKPDIFDQVKVKDSAPEASADVDAYSDLGDTFDTLEIQYKLYNTETDFVEGTEFKTPAAVRSLNDILRKTGKPQRWIRTLLLINKSWGVGLTHAPPSRSCSSTGAGTYTDLDCLDLDKISPNWQGPLVPEWPEQVIDKLIARDMRDAKTKAWHTREIYVAVGLLGFVLWIVGRFIRYGFSFGLRQETIHG